MNAEKGKAQIVRKHFWALDQVTEGLPEHLERTETSWSRQFSVVVVHDPDKPKPSNIFIRGLYGFPPCEERVRARVPSFPVRKMGVCM